MTVSGTTITDKGKLELDNTVKLTGGATIQGASSSLKGPITNLGTLELAGAATLLNDTLTNTGHIVQVDDGQTLTLSGTEIIGGTINDLTPLGTGGIIDVTGDSTIDGGATLNKGALTVESVAKLTLDTMTESGTTITDKGKIELDNTVKLTGGASIQGASSSLKGPITNLGTLEVAGAATLLNDTLTNTGHIVQVDDGQTLTLSGTEIIGGTINDLTPLGTGGIIEVSGDSTIDGGATLNKGALTVESVAKLTLDSMTVSGTTITDKGKIELDNTVKLTGGATIQGASSSLKGPITNLGTLEVAGAATLLNDTLTNTGHIVQVAHGHTLPLSGTEIIGGTINDLTPLGTGGIIDVTGDSTIDDGATLNKGALTVESVAKLTLDTMTVSGTTITDKGKLELDNTVKLTGGATIQGASSSLKGPITNLGTLEVAGAATLLNDTLTNTGHIVQVDDGQTLTLSATEIIGGTINDLTP